MLSTPKHSAIIAVAILCISLSLTAGLRGPGKYNGVVIFDRWDNCILFSNVYVMYVSESVKEDLRPYAGQAMEVEAQEVVQRENPGDGLIKKYKIIGPSQHKHLGIPIDGVRLRLSGAFGDQKPPNLLLAVENQGPNSIEISSRLLGLLVIAKMEPDFANFESPSDGPSVAVITRSYLRNPGQGIIYGPGGKRLLFTANISNAGDVPDVIRLEPRASKTLTINLSLPSGKYQAFVGYGVGVHEEKTLASNPVSFDIAENGHTVLVQ